MTRVLLASTLLLSALVGCQRDEGYSELSVQLEPSAVVVFIRGRTHGDRRHPCPPSLGATARVNGIAMKQRDYGLIEDMPDSDDVDCQGLSWRLDRGLLPADTETLDITFDPPPDGEYDQARAWHVTVDWRPLTRVWTEDDLAARMQANEEFEVRWQPPDAALPELELGAFAQGALGGKVTATASLVSSEPGSARFRFKGPEPSAVWEVIAVQPELQVTLCSGFKRCRSDQQSRVSLQPGGISPTRPDAVAPPRACIAAPGAPASRYRSQFWFPFPDLSMLRVARRMSCDGPDLYFVLLGACGICGGGMSTYVVGNRGTEAASFSVRSNRQTVEGAVLEPQQRSAPFEIVFDGELSELEILSDADCDATSNSAWVASVVCDEPAWPGALLTAGGEACNNTCRP